MIPPCICISYNIASNIVICAEYKRHLCVSVPIGRMCHKQIFFPSFLEFPILA